MEVGDRRQRDGGRHAGMEPGQAWSSGCGMKKVQQVYFLPQTLGGSQLSVHLCMNKLMHTYTVHVSTKP